MPHIQNRLLSFLSQSELEQLRPHLDVVDMKLGEVLGETHEPIKQVHFPYGGIISCVVPLENGDMVEAGMIGQDGAMGGVQALDHKISVGRMIVQAAGKASVIDPDRLRQLAENIPKLRSLLVKYEQFFLGQVQQSVACNATHLLEQRMCRWILRMHDLIGPELPLTQEFLAQMLGVGRSSVSMVAGTLQHAGLIKYRRGRIQIVDLERLQDSACECHDAVRGHHAKIFEKELATT